MGDEKVVDRIKNYIIFDIKHMNLELIRIYLRFTKNYFLALLRKTQNLSSEYFFWERYYNQKYIQNPENVIGNKNHKLKKSIENAINIIKKDENYPIKCIEVGCGPTSQFYSHLLENRSQYEILTVDPLAKIYNKLHRKYKTNYGIECIVGYGENLNKLLERNSFDIVYSQNAIDHSHNPFKFAQNLYNITKQNRYIILNGFTKEGSAAKWLGLHKWNIEIENNDLVVSNKDKSINKRKLFGNLNLKTIMVDISGYNIGDKYTYIFKKTH